MNIGKKMGLGGIGICMLYTLLMSLAAQTVGGGYDEFFEEYGSSDHGQLGYAVSGAGDLNNDGFDDIMVTEIDWNGLYNVVHAYSGADGTELYGWSNFRRNSSYGMALSDLGDINMDGHDDVLIGDPLWHKGGTFEHPGMVQVRSGANGRPLYQWEGRNHYDHFGGVVTDAGDIDQDGVVDILIGATGVEHAGTIAAGAIYLRSGADGSKIKVWRGTVDAPGRIGGAISSAGDVNADGIPDLIIGVHGPDSGALKYAGSAQVISGADFSVLHEWFGTEENERLGETVADIGDINQDGFDDVMVGAPYASHGGKVKTGRVTVYSGADGSVIYNWYGPWKRCHMGGRLSNAGDITGDGVNDALVGHLHSGQRGSWVRVFDGATGRQVYARGGSSDDDFGWSLADAGDTNGDGWAEIIVGDRENDELIAYGGAFYVMGFSPFIQSSNEQISISAGGRAVFDLNFPDDAVGLNYKLLASASGNGPINIGVDIPLTNDGLFQKTWYGTHAGTAAGMWHGTLDHEAKAAPFLRIRPGTNSFLIGHTIQIAGVALEPGGTAIYSSIAVSLIFGS